MRDPVSKHKVIVEGAYKNGLLSSTHAHTSKHTYMHTYASLTHTQALTYMHTHKGEKIINNHTHGLAS